ncbi:hypothetical protein MLD38_008686 [Melastoma candidum]|uniref:Uncharacterized protein n=1 Tax=Melastoma candidum TaxID=119954 RepID=A0ACB9RUR7_9MYRT|nr:hypothetical protein MLD38_008686 [Melastoma candidum]
MSTLNAVSLGSSSPMSLPVNSAPSTSHPAISSSPMTVDMNLWQNKANAAAPSLQLPSSRLKAMLIARDMDFEMEFLGSEAQAANNQRQQLMDEISRLTSTASCFSRTQSDACKPRRHVRVSRPFVDFSVAAAHESVYPNIPVAVPYCCTASPEH